MCNNFLKSICWDITSRCNENCGFCYREPFKQELPLDANKAILKKLIDFGVDKISFVGGEPLLYEELFELVTWGRKYAQEKTCFSITTNSTLLTGLSTSDLHIDYQKLETLISLFEWITFSLDAPTKELQQQMGRNEYHIERTLLILSYLGKLETNHTVKIKINSILSEINYQYMIELYELLLAYPIKRWKLFRFLPSRGNALQTKNIYNITEELFANKCREILEYNKAKGNPIKITINDYDAFNSSYVTISSDGKVVIYDGSQYKVALDLITDKINDISKLIDIDKHINHRSDFLLT